MTTRMDLYLMTTENELALGCHVQAACHAIEYRNGGHIDLARQVANHAREMLQRYLEVRGEQ